MFFKNLFIYSERLYLRILTIEDASEVYLSWFRDPDINRFIESVKSTNSITQIESFIREKSISDNAILFGIFLKENDKHIGNIKYEPIDFDRKLSIMGIMIGDKESRNRGYGSEALKASSKWLHQFLKIENIYLGVHFQNEIAIQSYKKVGFEVTNQIPLIEKKQDTLYMCLNLPFGQID